jgi:cell division protein FtsI/penicillin-binding protein 2
LGVTRRQLLAALVSPASAAVVLRAVSAEVLLDTSPAAQARFHPGSTVKPFTAVAAIEGGNVQPQRCAKQLRIGVRRLDCSHPVSPEPLDLSAALAYSCNSFFAGAGSRLDVQALTGTLRRYGFDLEFPQTPDQRALMAVGEWGVYCSLRELAEAYRKLASKHNDRVVEGLKAAAEYGTARLARPRNVPVAGKTGTTKTHALFAGWAPADAPRIIVAVSTRNGRGGSDAAPIARSLFEKYL